MSRRSENLAVRNAPSLTQDVRAGTFLYVSVRVLGVLRVCYPHTLPSRRNQARTRLRCQRTERRTDSRHLGGAGGQTHFKISATWCNWVQPSATRCDGTTGNAGHWAIRLEPNASERLRGRSQVAGARRGAVREPQGARACLLQLSTIRHGVSLA